MARAVLINAGQANAATGDAGYQDAVECATAVASLLKLSPQEVFIMSTGVIGQRIKKDALFKSLHSLVRSYRSSMQKLPSVLVIAVISASLTSKARLGTCGIQQIGGHLGSSGCMSILAGINALALRRGISSRIAQLILLYNFLTFYSSNGGYFFVICNLSNLGDKVLVKGRVIGMCIVSRGVRKGIG